MALKQLRLAAKIKELTARLEGLEKAQTDIRARRDAWKLREANAETALSEIDENTTQEERDAFDAEVTAIEKEDSEIREDEQKNADAIKDCKAELENTENELENLRNENENSKNGVENNKNGSNAEKRNEGVVLKVERMDEIRNEILKREEVRNWIADVRVLAKNNQERAITGKELLIPEVVLPLIYDSYRRNSKLMKHVNVQNVGGKARATVMGDIPEAVWTEMCANINELSLSFTQVEVDGYKVGGYIAICNALLEDNDISLASVIIDAIGQAIGYAVDKAILYGTGTKMPLGIATRLAQATKPTTYPSNARPWVKISTTNIKTIANTNTGAKLMSEIVKAAGAAKAKNGNGKFWAMNEATYSALMAEFVSFSASGAVVSGMNNQMPVVGGAIEILDFIPDNNIFYGYGSKYLIANRSGTSIERSDHVKFLEDQTVFRGTARMDGLPVIAEAFVLIGINGATPTTSATFASDAANTPPSTGSDL